MRRRFFALVSAVSLMLCLAVCALWVRSYRVADFLEETRPTMPSDLPIRGVRSAYVDQINSSNGMITLTVFWDMVLPWTGVRYRHEAPDDSFSASERHLGFGYHAEEQGIFSYYERTISFPHWSVALIFLLPAGFRLLAVLKRRRRRKGGKCLACGYDLRATPGRCPECGAVAPEPKA